MGKAKVSSFLYLAPLLMYMVIFFAYPAYLLTYYSFTDFSLQKLDINFIGINNYVNALTGRGLFYYINQIIYTLVVTFGSLVLGLGMALLVNKISNHRTLQKAFSALLMIPILMIPTAIGVTWIFMYSEYYGPINHLLRLIGLPTGPWLATPWSLWFVMVSDIWGWTPFVYIILLAALQQINPSILEAAELDGATGFRKLIHVILPSLMPIIIILTSLKLIDTYKEFDMLYTMTRGGPGDFSTTLNVAIYRAFYIYKNFGLACAYGILTLLFPIIVVLGYFYVSKKIGEGT